MLTSLLLSSSRPCFPAAASLDQVSFSMTNQRVHAVMGKLNLPFIQFSSLLRV